jgi:hypothetical protein
MLVQIILFCIVLSQTSICDVLPSPILSVQELIMCQQLSQILVQSDAAHMGT